MNPSSASATRGFHFDKQNLKGEYEGDHYVAYENGERITYQKFVELLSSPTPLFREELTRQLQQSEYDAFFWECPSFTKETLQSILFEFVIIKSSFLSTVEPNTETFKKYFDGCSSEDVVHFKNLGGDATLVVPCHVTAILPTSYTHIANFVRHAPPAQVDSMWRKVASTLADNVGDKKMWLSTSGAGVYWLHVRLDSFPKYYNYRPYKQ